MTQRPQDFASHARWFPLYHFVVLPATIVNIVWATRRALATPSAWNWWTAAMAVVISLLAVAARMMALSVQNRVIRLEMSLRLAAVLPPELAKRASALRVRHLIALRFAGDAELPALVERCLSGELSRQRDIKAAITDWQPDWLRA